MAGVQLPEDRQQGLVAEQHLPGGLDPQGGAGAAAVVEGVQDVAGETVGGEPLPGIELEEAADEAQPVVDEAAGEPVPADLLHGDPVGLQAGLFGGLLEVGDRHEVLAQLVVRGVREVQGVAGRQQRGLLPPGVDEAFVEAVPLVGAGEAVLHPEPLRGRRLDERGRGVRVVLQEFGGAGAVVAQVEAGVDGGEFGAAVPGLGDGADDARVGDAEVGEAVLGDDVPGGRQAHAVEFLDDVLQRLHLGQGEDVVGALVPVGAQGVVGVAGQGVDQPLFLDGLLPAGAGFGGAAFHGRAQPPPLPEPEQPKPPRSTASDRLKVPESAQPLLTSPS
ncbi:hypothetical protein STENM223S_06639 [Streptomyces tendae]